MNVKILIYPILMHFSLILMIKKHPIQIIILAIKWLFMELDCAYWNYSGRKKLFESLVESGLV